jgi:hypothetical protein
MIRGRLQELSTYRQFKQDCKVVFASPQGKRILRFLMKKGCVTTPVASIDRDDSLRNQGAQRLVLSLLKATYKNETELEEEIENSHED